MKPSMINPICRFSFHTLLLLMLVACTGITVEVKTTPTQFTPDSQEANGLSQDEKETLRSLEKVDAYPFYVMHYYGGYDYPQFGAARRVSGEYACSLFATLGESADMLYGRNFDWNYSPAMLLFTDPPDGYASVSMVDLTFLDLTPDSSGRLVDQPLENRVALLSAPSMPFDGMNEFGLTIGMAALPDQFLDDAGYDPARPTIGSIGIIRQILDHARNVDEALELIARYNIDFSGGPPIHYLIADPGGKAVLVEFYQGEMVRLPNEAPWHLATNHLRYTAEGDGGCQRYQTISDRFAALNGLLEPREAIQLLSDVSQDITQWSTVYNMTTGAIDVVISRRFENVFSFQLELQHP
jgi:Acyl-coenzyme A:6-aminopenicillanic acid acyl-transferase